MRNVEIHGYAIVSDNDRIADANDRIADAAGGMPDALRNEADWAYFQAELNRSDVTVLGRLGHEANPNPRGRLRMILSSSSNGIERRPDGWWWNPQKLSWDDAIHMVLPYGGRVAVPGGRQVFDLFLTIGYTTFHLTRAEGAFVPGGVAVFSDCDAGKSAETVLAATGLEPGPRQILDPAGPVGLVLWRR